MKRNRVFRLLASLTVVVLCMTAFSVTAFAGGGDGDYYTGEPAETTPEPTEEPATGGMEPEGDLINLMGGKNEFVNELDSTFSTPLGISKYIFYAQLPDHVTTSFPNLFKMSIGAIASVSSNPSAKNTYIILIVLSRHYKPH